MDSLSPPSLTEQQLHTLWLNIQQHAQQLGFEQCGVSDVDLSQAEPHLLRWLENQYHGEMDYMSRHGTKRSRPAELVAGTLRIISVRMNYLPEATPPIEVLNDPDRAYVSRYALGRDYHKIMRKRLAQLADFIRDSVATFEGRAFVDSAPVLEKAIAEKAGLGWIGKHSNLINRDAGSWFFLGELFTNLPLPVNVEATQFHCGRCTACITACPTQAIVAPFEIDARRCISYLTIEYQGSIPLEFRPLLGNRIYGCDDCQLFCPWNRFAKTTAEADFRPRHQLDNITLCDLFQWTEAQFMQNFEGSPIRRIGYVNWLRNIAVGLGNAPTSEHIINALHTREQHPSELLREHVHWALARHGIRSSE
ncbi:MAG: tRNA epoxyqueuosine(34) reductase QueG [Gammaproteobacteria bacterium]|nr:tRNA epoxyqueuosine(34) reductase QueG [Gammaproteobacteria bacterium]